jgi:hypothetical protein
MDQTSQAYSTASTMTLGWIDASLQANERFAKVARTWIDETLGAQYDMAEALKRAAEGARSAMSAESDQPVTPAAFWGRAGEVARSNYAVWTETGMKAQERITRVAQTAFEEIRSAQSEFAAKSMPAQ